MPEKNQDKSIHLRKYRFPWFLVACIWTGTAAFLVLRLDPIIVRDILVTNSYSPLLLAVFLGVNAILMTLTLNLLRAVVWGLLVVIGLVLRFSGYGNWLNLTLLFSLLITLEYAWRLSKEKSDDSAKKLDNS